MQNTGVRNLLAWLRRRLNWLPSRSEPVRHHQAPPGRARFRPGLEELEDRTLLHAGHSPVLGPLVPLLHDTPLAMPIHVHLRIVVNGVPQVIPADIGVGPDGALPVHTHDTTGKLHIESLVVRDFRLHDFFTAWGQPFGARQVLGHRADGSHRITMSVNGRPSTAFESLVLRDDDAVVIRYERADAVEETIGSPDPSPGGYRPRYAGPGGGSDPGLPEWPVCGPGGPIQGGVREVQELASPQWPASAYSGRGPGATPAPWAEPPVRTAAALRVRSPG